MRYLFLLAQGNNEWMLLSRDGNILTTTKPDESVPKIIFSDKTPIPHKDWEDD